MSALLKRVNGDEALATRLLDNFCRTHGETPQRIAAAQAAGHPAEAHRLSHTLAGLASNLGLPRLSVAARTVEQAVLSAGAASAAALEELAAQAAEAIAVAGALEPPTEDAPLAAPEGDVAALAESLECLLAANDLDALQLAAKLYAADRSPATAAVRDAVERLDFHAAQGLLAPLRRDGSHG